MTDQPTNYQLAQQLHRAMLECLCERLQQPNVSADYLAVARRFLRQQGFLGLASGNDERERLQALYATYVNRLAEAARVERPSAAILVEVRKFLDTQGVGKDLGAAVDSATALSVLKDQRLPFQ